MVHIWQRIGLLRKDPCRKRWCSDREGKTHGQKGGQSLWADGKVGENVSSISSWPFGSLIQ